jgi:hypothetical protein
MTFNMPRYPMKSQSAKTLLLAALALPAFARPAEPGPNGGLIEE